ANAVAAGSGMQGDIDGGVGGVGEKGAVVKGEVGVRVAQDEGGDAAILEFLAETAGEGDGDVLLGEGGAEGLAAVIAAVAGVHNGEVTARAGSRRICRGLGGRVAWRRSRGRRRNCGWGGLRFCGSEGDGSTIGAETGEERDGGGYGDFGGAI